MMYEKEKYSLKQALAQGQVVAPCVWDCMSAHIAEQTGFKALAVSSASFSEFGAGMPDTGLISPEDMVRRVETICLYTPLPVIADCEFGGGETPLNTYRFVKQLVHVGVSAVCIEDSTGMRGKERRLENAQHAFPLVDEETWLSKIAAAKEACEGSECLVIASTLAGLNNNEQDACRRAELARKMGADVVLAEGLSGKEQAKLLANQEAGCKAWILDAEDNLSVKELEELGYGLVLAHIFEAPGFANMVEVGKRVWKEQTTVYSDSFRSPVRADGTLYPPVGYGVKWLEKEDSLKKKARQILEEDV